MNPSFAEISVQELASKLQDRESGLQLIDVREPFEIELASLEGFTVLPLSEHTDWASDMTTRFDPEAETLVICHHGMRSAQMCQWLQSIGFRNVKNVAGGIDAYSVFVDPRIPRY